MNLEHIRIGMPLFTAQFYSSEGTITVYRGVVKEVSREAWGSKQDRVTLMYDSGSEGTGTRSVCIDSGEVFETVLEAVEAMYLRLMLGLRLYGSATRKSEWLFRFLQIKAGEVPFNVPIPVQGKEEEDEAILDKFVQGMVAQRMAEPIMIPASELPQEVVDRIPSEEGRKRYPPNGIDFNDCACQCKPECSEDCDGSCGCPAHRAQYSDRHCER